MNKLKRIEILERLRENNPNPQTELNWNTPFELLIAVLLSAQATDVSVNKATDKLYPVANTPQAILELGVDGLKDYIKTIGLFNSKAENVIKTCRILLEKYQGEVPEDRDALESLPGVGRKQPMSFSTRLLAGQRLPLIPISSVCPTEPNWLRAKMSTKLNRNY